LTHFAANVQQKNENTKRKEKNTKRYTLRGCVKMK